MDKSIKILLVDDDEATRGLYAEVFKRHDFEVSEATDGVDGLDQATKNRPDIIFTGIIMPRMDGFALFEALKKNVATSSIPVVISSHMGREEDRKKARELGASDFIARDMSTPNEAVERIKSILNLAEYRLKFSAGEADAPQLAKDMHFSEKFLCAACDGEAVLALKLKDAATHEFSAKFVCGKCGRPQE